MTHEMNTYALSEHLSAPKVCLELSLTKVWDPRVAMGGNVMQHRE